MNTLRASLPLTGFRPRTDGHGRYVRKCLPLLLCVATTLAASAQTFKVLASFNSTDGASPHYAPLVQGLDGNFYGTTTAGGATNNGAVFKITPKGVLATLYSFCPSTPCTDGSGPIGGLVLGSDGNFYGTTFIGGNRSCNAWGCGTVFKITPKGTLTTLYSFCTQTSCTDGELPQAGLVQGADGAFYGTTFLGGTHSGGTVFKITSTGTLTTLYNFCSMSSCNDGGYPISELILAGDGNFYGTTQWGGSGSGSIFRITPGGVLTTLYRFTGGGDGANPLGALVYATDGNFYGTTPSGGTSTNCSPSCGTVFKMTPSGTLTTLYNFCAQTNCADGGVPISGLVQATDRNLYGTTSLYGANALGTIFQIGLSGTLTTLHSFSITDGSSAVAGMVQATNGALYGPLSNGGANNVGTVFSLSIRLGGFVETMPTSGKVGASVTILGTNLTGTSSVSFSGTAATFTVVSGSEITTTVPTGATTGFVTVTTPSGTLTSNKKFRVLP